MSFQSNVKIWNEVKKDRLRWEKLQLSLLGRISVINVLLRMLLLFQTLPIPMTDVTFKQQQKGISKIVWQLRIKYKLLQDAKERGELELPNVDIVFCSLLFNMDERAGDFKK